MKRARFLIGLLSLSLTLLVTTAFAASSSAALYCYQLAGCSGQAGCAGFYSSVSGCTIYCSDGLRVSCYYVIADDPPCFPCPREPIEPEFQ